MQQYTFMHTYHVNPLFRCLEKGDNVGVLSHSLSGVESAKKTMDDISDPDRA